MLNSCTECETTQPQTPCCVIFTRFLLPDHRETMIWYICNCSPLLRIRYLSSQSDYHKHWSGPGLDLLLGAQRSSAHVYNAFDHSKSTTTVVFTLWSGVHVRLLLALCGTRSQASAQITSGKLLCTMRLLLVSTILTNGAPTTWFVTGKQLH